MDYINATQVAAFAQELDALGPGGIDLVVTAASRLFDNLAGVDEDFFAAYVAPEAPATGYTNRIYYGDGTAYLKLDPYTALNPTDPVTIVDSDATELTLPEYYERNGFLVIKNYGAGVPIRFNTTLTRSAWPSENGLAIDVATSFIGWPLDQKITVSAKWGFSEVPADVQLAVVQLAIHLWRTGDPAFTQVSQSGEPYSPPAIPAQAQEVADRYRERYSTRAVFA